jgi:hypothetical protein
MKTGCWFASLPGDHIRIGISRGVPRGLAAGYRLFRKLAPGPWFNSCTTHAEYDARYQAEILAPLCPSQVFDEIEAIAQGKVPALCCFERAGGLQWCHRSLVSEWFANPLGLIVPEFGFDDGRHHQHPLMSPELDPERALPHRPYKLASLPLLRDAE